MHLGLGLNLTRPVVGGVGVDYSLNGLNPELVADFPNAYHRSGGTDTTFADLFTHTRASTATYIDSSGAVQVASSGVARVLNHVYNGSAWVPAGMLIEEQRTNLFLNSATLSTQGVTTTAQEYTVSFSGTGTITFSGAHTGSLVGTGSGEENRVNVTFTPAAGTVTCTVSGTVSNAQFEDGNIPTSYIPTTSGTVTRAADALSIAAAKVPWSSTGLSYALEGYQSYADEDDTTQIIMLEQRIDNSNRIELYLSTGSTRTGSVYGYHRVGGTADQLLLDAAQYTPGADVEFNAAMRLTNSDMNVGGNGAIQTPNTTLPSLVDVSAIDLDIGNMGFNGNIKTLRVWGADIGDAGLTEFVS